MTSPKMGEGESFSKMSEKKNILRPPHLQTGNTLLVPTVHEKIAHKILKKDEISPHELSSVRSLQNTTTAEVTKYKLMHGG